jgi:hypothetical protein
MPAAVQQRYATETFVAWYAGPSLLSPQPWLFQSNLVPWSPYQPQLH